MPKIITVFRIFVASPSDLDEERMLLEEVIRELNLTWPHTLGVSLELIKWETHVIPGAGNYPQEVINKQLPTDYDIFLGMFWSRIGTTTPHSQSGTIEEFESAYQRWQQNPKSIRLMIYFKTTPLSPDNIDTDQLRLLKEFRNSLSEKGILYDTFKGGEEFSQLLRVHLSRQVQELLKPGDIATNPSVAPIAGTPESMVEKSVELPEDEGFLDLIETVVTASQRATEVMKHITDALEQLNSGTHQSTLDMEAVKGDDNTKFAAYKRISNKQAENMADFVARMRPEISILDDSLSLSLDSFGQAIILFTDFGSNPESYSQLINALSAAAELRDSIVQSKENTEQFRSVIATLPRITIQFNRAKRDLLNVLDTFLATNDRGLNLLGAIETTGNSIIESWVPQATPPSIEPDQQTDGSNNRNPAN